jgi:hypothetical protein
MSGNSGQLDGGGLLAEFATQNPRLAQVLQTIIDGVNNTARNAGVSVTGDIPSPKSPDSVTVATAGEMVHVSINHTGPVDRNVRYFSEIAADTGGNPAFGRPIVKDHGTSRTPEPFSLPTMDGNGNPYTYSLRSYAQNPGGPPSIPTMASGGTFTLSGSTNLTLLPSTGSGTAPNNGQSAGQGLGRNQRRMA